MKKLTPANPRWLATWMRQRLTSRHSKPSADSTPQMKTESGWPVCAADPEPSLLWPLISKCHER